MTVSDDQKPEIYYHGTKANLNQGDLIAPGYSSNYGGRKKAVWVYLTATLNKPKSGCPILLISGSSTRRVVFAFIRICTKVNQVRYTFV